MIIINFQMSGLIPVAWIVGLAMINSQNLMPNSNHKNIHFLKKKIMLLNKVLRAWETINQR